MAGAGTSGRLAVQAAAIHGRGSRIQGLLAGGMDAFFRAKEGVEDNPECGGNDLKRALPPEGPFIYLGITCGLSAAYVAGAAAEALKQGHRAKGIGILGFNPLAEANQRFLPALKGSFQDLLFHLSDRANGYCLTPVIGPEPVRGSTRMKGGSATKMILDALFLDLAPRDWLMRCAHLRGAMEDQFPRLASCISEAGRALNSGRDVIYLAGAREGLMALLDASECPPTFGSKPKQVRAYLSPGFAKLLPAFSMAGHRLEEVQHQAEDALFAVGGEDDLTAFQQQLKLKCRSLPRLVRGSGKEERCLADLADKWCFNTISTGAFIQAGKVFGNRMIDLRISNLKLWERAQRIVADLAGTSREKAAELLKKAADLTEKENPAELIPRLAQKEKLVATALLLAREPMDAATAREILVKEPLLRKTLERI